MIEDKIVSVFSSPDGKDVLEWLCKSAGILDDVGYVDPNQLMFKEGARSVVMRILHIMETDHEGLRDYVRSHNSKKRR